jgi:putative thioredoxin
MDNFSKDVTSASFEKDVLQASEQVPVVVDFWAEWCAPCKALKPILEKLAAEYGGKFVLAKVDTDANSDLAAQFGVRGIPNVKAFVGGAAVAEFSGAIPESAVRAFLDKIIPTPAEKLRLAARKAFGEGDFETAESRLQEAVRLDPAHREARLDLVEALIARQAFSEAEIVLQAFPERERDERADRFATQIALWKKGQSLPKASELAAAVARAPQDLGLRLQLGERLVAERDFEAALAQLIEVVRADRGALREQARRTIVEVFGLAANQDELVSRYRRMLASALY